jgi:hypothetical protein
MNKNQNVSIPAGDTPTLTIAITVADESAFDPTGATGTWWMGKTSSSSGADVLLKKSTATTGASFVQDSTTLEWSLWVTLAEADTESQTPGNYYHEALIVEASGIRSRIMTGTFTVIPTIIR